MGARMVNEKREEKFCNELKKLQNEVDVEHNHFEADKLLCLLLTELGYLEVVKEFAKVKRWYG